jgi:hypothetical protein
VLLDAWLKLGIFGPIVLLVILLCVLLLGFALYRAISTCRRLLREGEMEQFWLTAGLVALLCVPVAALIVTSFVDTREEKQLVLDLRNRVAVVFLLRPLPVANNHTARSLLSQLSRPKKKDPFSTGPSISRGRK